MTNREKTIILVAAILIVVLSCFNFTLEVKEHKVEASTESVGITDWQGDFTSSTGMCWKVIKIDKCEYIYWQFSADGRHHGLIRKEDCNSSKQQQK